MIKQLLQFPSFLFPQGCWQRALKSYTNHTSSLVLSLHVPITTVTNKQDFKQEELVALWCRCTAPKSTKLLFALCGSSNGRMKTALLKLRQSANRSREESWELWHFEILNKEQLERSRQREQAKRCRGLGEKCLQDRALTHPCNSKTSSGWKPGERRESWRGHLMVSHTHQLAVGSGVACG